MKSPALLLLLVAISIGFGSIGFGSLVGCGDPDKPLREPTSDKNFDDPDDPGGGGASDKPIVRDGSVDRESSSPAPDGSPQTEASVPPDAPPSPLDALPE